MLAVLIRWRNQKQLELFKNKYYYHVIGTNNLERSSEQILEIHADRMGSKNYNKEFKEGYTIEWMSSNDFTKNTNYFYRDFLLVKMLFHIILKNFVIGLLKHAVN
ncbi:MAG: hypothetical protein KAS51_00065 [Candidatus Omnitrophica bacterium]|nr:hypothetical protein [Candidatus Omnitrophota bacterium]